MRKILTICLFLMLAWAASSVPASAHHGYAAYDMTEVLSVKATVTGLTIVNPHSWLNYDTKDDHGDVQHWVAEAGPVRLMRELGWTMDTVEPGDQITVYYHAAKNGAHSVDLVKIKRADGQIFLGHSVNGVNER